jgi:hypothetical protein
LTRGGVVPRKAKRAAREAKPWVIWFGRLGFAAKGVVYTLIGVLAVLAAIGAGGDTTGPRGALAEIGEAPFGRFLLTVMAVGIVGYALWRFLQALMDTENNGTDGKGIFKRTTYFIIGWVHVGLAISAFALVRGEHPEANPAQAWTARLLSQPFGQWLVGIVGTIIIIYGGIQFHRAYSLSFCDKLELKKMSPMERKWATRLGRMGYAARGVVFWIVGIFLIVAAIYVDPKQARGLDGALATLAEQPWGPALLGVVAAGLVAHGIFMFVQARYRRMVLT